MLRIRPVGLHMIFQNVFKEKAAGKYLFRITRGLKLREVARWHLQLDIWLLLSKGLLTLAIHSGTLWYLT